MSSERHRRIPRSVRTLLPWVTWALAAAGALVLSLSGRGLGSAPAAVEMRSVSVSSPQPLRIVSVAVHPGDLVAQGQAIASLDPTRADANLLAAKGQLERLHARLASLTNYRAKAAGHEAALGSRLAQELSQLEADEKRDRSELAQLDAQVERQSSLVAEKLASADMLNELTLKRAALVERVTAYAALLQRSRASQQASVGRLERWSAQRPAPGTPGNEAVAPLEAAIAAQEAYCAQLEKLRNSLDLVAPLSGRVALVAAHAGEAVRIGDPIVTIVDEHPTVAIAYIDESWASQVRVGDLVTLKPSDGSSATHRGRVTVLGPSIAETPARFQLMRGRALFSREARVELEPTSEPAIPGESFVANFRRPSGIIPVGLLGER